MVRVAGCVGGVEPDKTAVLKAVLAPKRIGVGHVLDCLVRLSNFADGDGGVDYRQGNLLENFTVSRDADE